MSLTAVQAAQMWIDALDAIAPNAAGVLSATVDGETVTFTSADDVARTRNRYQSVVDRANGTRPLSAKLNLGEF